MILTFGEFDLLFILTVEDRYSRMELTSLSSFPTSMVKTLASLWSLLASEALALHDRENRSFNSAREWVGRDDRRCSKTVLEYRSSHAQWVSM